MQAMTPVSEARFLTSPPLPSPSGQMRPIAPSLPLREHSLPSHDPQETPPPRFEQPTPRILVSLATYNEAENLQPLIAEIHRYLPDAHLLVVDDNSPDGTGRIAEELAATDPRIHVLHRPGKLGLGTATLDAMNYAILNGYDYLQNLDADFSHPPRYLPGIIQGMMKNDVMIGSRYARGGATENWPLPRLVISRTVNLLVRFLFRMPVMDASGAFRCYRVSKLKEAELGRTESRGYSFQQEVLFRIHKAGAKLGEVPIVFENRRAGKSKVNQAEALRSIMMILWLGCHHFFGLEDFRPSSCRDVAQ
jgi:dolichol-phosphate mannosyltransferase